MPIQKIKEGNNYIDISSLEKSKDELISITQRPNGTFSVNYTFHIGTFNDRREAVAAEEEFMTFLRWKVQEEPLPVELSIGSFELQISLINMGIQISRFDTSEKKIEISEAEIEAIEKFYESRGIPVVKPWKRRNMFEYLL